jgi:sialate O-acetylesterase
MKELAVTTVRRFGLAMILVTGWAVPALAAVTMPAIFGSHMVLQQGMKVPVWGTADRGEKVTVSFAGQTVTADAADGTWRVALAPMAASATGRTLTVTGTNVLRFEDVLVGEIWVCSGQSNMVLQAGWTDNGAQEIKAADFPSVRMITVPPVTARTPQRTFDGKMTP